MLGRSEFALRQGFAAQNTCTAQKRRASFLIFLQNDLKATENIAIIRLKNKNAAAYGCANTHMPAQVLPPPTQ